MRFFSLWFGVLCTPLIYVLARRLFNRPVALVSALLVTTSPYLVWYSQEVKMYTVMVALSLLSIYSLRRAIEGGRWTWWLTQTGATTLAFYSHILGALLIPVHVLLYLAWWPRARKRWRGALVSAALLTIPYLPLVVWQAPLALKARETGFHPRSLDQMITILLNGWSAGVSGWGSSWGAAFMGLLATGGVLATVIPTLPPHARNKAQAGTEAQDGLALLIWLLIPVLGVWLVSLRQPLFTDRYLIWTAPAFYIFVAVALTFLANSQSWGRWVVVPLLGAILALNGASLWKQATNPIKSDFRAAAAYLVSYGKPPDTVEHSPSEADLPTRCFLPIVSVGRSEFEGLIIFQIPHGRYTFDYYFPIEGYPWAAGVYTNHRLPNGEYRMSEQELAWRMRDATDGFGVVWLVATEVSMWDERNLVQRWLDEHAQEITVADFALVRVHRYVMPET
jgi:hypothetical protein